MAKKIIDWNETDGVLRMDRNNSLPLETLAIFDIAKIFPGIQKMNEVQKHLTVYGIKQSLADAGSSDKTAELKAESARKKWQLFIDGKVRVKKAGAVSKAKTLDSLLAMSPEEALEAIKAMQADA